MTPLVYKTIHFVFNDPLYITNFTNLEKIQVHVNSFVGRIVPQWEDFTETEEKNN